MSITIVRLLLFAGLFFNSYGCSNTETTSSDVATGTTGFSIKGLCLVAPVKPIDDSRMQPMVNIHANSIAIMPYAYCSSNNPVVTYNYTRQWWGECDKGIITCIQWAHKNNLTVMIKPHLWIGSGEYTGNFILHSEIEEGLWENSYREYILHFATIADNLHAELFCMGTELGAYINKKKLFWSSLIDTLKKIYHGKLTYAANWDDYQYFPFWEKLDYIGVDAYFPLATEATPSVPALQKAWKKYSNELEKISGQLNRPVLFTEYGYRNVDYNCSKPWKENEGNQNNEAQSNAFKAFYQHFAGKKWFAGGYVWKWYADEMEWHHHNSPIDFTPQNKPAAKVIENWYRN